MNSVIFGFRSNIYTLDNSKLARNDFQKKLSDDINNIKSSENRLIFADRATNLYKMTPEEYKTILTNNVTKIYRKAERSTRMKIDRKAKTISRILQLHRRMERYSERPAFISLKRPQGEFRT